MYNIPIFQCCDGLLFSVRFLGNETSPESFLLHNALARKPKRIRTAFSPSQLLRLEHAFEKNHYVVGAERKQLAHSLSLTETQVRNTNQSSKHYFSTPPCFVCFFPARCGGLILKMWCAPRAASWCMRFALIKVHGSPRSLFWELISRSVHNVVRHLYFIFFALTCPVAGEVHYIAPLLNKCMSSFDNRRNTLIKTIDLYNRLANCFSTPASVKKNKNKKRTSTAGRQRLSVGSNPPSLYGPNLILGGVELLCFGGRMLPFKMEGKLTS